MNDLVPKHIREMLERQDQLIPRHLREIQERQNQLISGDLHKILEHRENLISPLVQATLKLKKEFNHNYIYETLQIQNNLVPPEIHKFLDLQKSIVPSYISEFLTKHGEDNNHSNYLGLTKTQVIFEGNNLELLPEVENENDDDEDDFEGKIFKPLSGVVLRVSEELLEKLRQTPNLLYELSPYLFEEVIAELLSKKGFDVEVTNAKNDGGKDIYVTDKNALGTFLYLVECKKYAPNNPVGVGIVRQLHGVVQADRATAGILVTTSHYTNGAKEFQRKVAFQMQLKDYDNIQEWLYKK